jgi:putative transposase
VSAGHHRRHAEGKKELVGVVDGARDSAQSWKEPLLDLKRRTDRTSLTARRLVAGSRARVAVDPWATVLGAQDHERMLAQNQQSKAKRALQEIWMARPERCAHRLGGVRRDLGRQTQKAAECLTKHRDALLAFDFPAEHWNQSHRSSFATVRRRTICSKGRLLNKTGLAMMFKLTEAAEEKLGWLPQ